MKMIQVSNIHTIFDERIIHEGLNLSVKKGEIYGLLGPSGCGKSTLMREMISLQEFSEGEIFVFDKPLSDISNKELHDLKMNWGVLFQDGALFSSLNVFENIALPLVEYTNLSNRMIQDIVEFKINLVGLKRSDGFLYPAQISGGMRKKAALARALALDPQLLFLDEPTSGLDPISAREFDALILKLRDLLNLTIVMVSHDLQSIYATLDRMAIIDQKKIVFEGTLEEVLDVENHFIQTFFRESTSDE